MAQPVKSLLQTPGGLILIPRAHTKVGEKPSFTELSSDFQLCTMTYTPLPHLTEYERCMS